MVCGNIYGAGPPPLILLSGLKNLPNEIENLVYSNKVAIGSTCNGYMTKDMFLIWTILFINWLMLYRQSLPDALKEARALLILDGHTSRENPLASLLFRKAFVDVIILPSHTTHVLQWFDVGLAATLKRFYSSKFKKNLKDAANDPTLTTHAAKYRAAAIRTFVDAWAATATPSNCLAAAKETGVYPLNPNAPHESVFVRNLTNEEQMRYDARERRNAARLNISNKLLTDPTLIVQMAQQIRSSPKFAYLANIEDAMGTNYKDLVKGILENPQNESLLLSKMIPLFIPGKPPVYF